MRLAAEKCLPPVLLGLAFSAALIGINWSLPSSVLSKKIMPERWNSPLFLDKLSTSWQEIYDRSEDTTPLLNEIYAKAATPPEHAIKLDFRGDLPPQALYNSYRSMIIRSQYPDESLPLSTLAQMKPRELNFRPASFLYGGGYIYPLGAYYAALARLGIIRVMPMRQLLENPDSLGGVYTAGRVLSAASFAGICLLCFLIARLLSGVGSAMLAFIFALSSPILTVYAHYMTPHLWSTFWGLAAIFFTLKALPGLELKPLLLSGGCAGISIGSYWSQLQVLILLAAILLSAGNLLLKKNAALRIAAMLATCTSVFLIFNPYLISGWKTALKELGLGQSQMGYVYMTDLASLFTHVLPGAIGPAATIAVILGWGLNLAGNKPLNRNLAAACVLIAAMAPAAYISADFPSGIRRCLPWLGMSLILAASTLKTLTVIIPKFLKPPLLILLLAPGILLSLTYTLNFRQASSPESTFMAMGAKLDSMRPNARLGLLELPQPASSPYFRLDRWPLLLADGQQLAKLKDGDLPGYLLVNAGQKPSVANILKAKYELITAFYPLRMAYFRADPRISAANQAIEFYGLSEKR